MRLPLLLVGLAGCPILSDADLDRRFDRDGDGYKARQFDGLDCDDNDANVHPDAPEICDGVDNDCDDLVNADDPDMPDEVVLWALDADGDGFGSDEISERSCRVLAGYVHERGDCDDTDPDEFPGQTWFLDGDGDGIGLATRPRVECARPEAHSLVSGDCDDANDQIFPGAPERCNSGIDDDCDLMADVADDNVVDAALVYADLDGDDFGDDATAVLTCPEPDDVTVGGDCDDDDDTFYPGAPDPWYVGGDTDCSGGSDWDADGDGHDILGGDTAGDDCDDARNWIFPGAPEICDGAPNDCTDPGVWDETLEPAEVWFVPSVLSPPVPWTSSLEAGLVVDIAESGTLYLCDNPAGGAWSGTIDVTGGDVTIRAARGPGTSNLDATGLLTTNVTASGSSTILRIEDVTLAFGAPTGLTTTGGCVWANGVSSVALSGVTLKGCSATVGGGAALSGANVTVSGTTVLNNTADFGAGIFAQSTAATSIFNTTFTSNVAYQNGGGLFLAEFAGFVPTATVNNDTFSKNDATSGGAIYTEIDTSLAGTVITDNTADTGGGLYVRGGLQGADVTCSPGTQLLRNSTYAIALQRGTLATDLCDLAFSGADDNTTADIWTSMFGFVFSFEGPSTVTCSSNSGCF